MMCLHSNEVDLLDVITLTRCRLGKFSCPPRGRMRLGGRLPEMGATALRFSPTSFPQRATSKSEQAELF